MKKRQILTIVVGATVTVVLLLTPLPFQSQTSDAVGDSVHGPLFAILAFGLFRLLGGTPIDHWWMRSLISWLLVFGFSAILEVAQRNFGRSSSWHDLVANGFGAFAGALLAALPWQRSRLIKIATAAAAAMALAVSLYHPGTFFADRFHQRLIMPVLASFETANEMRHWTFGQALATRTDEFAVHGNLGLRLDLMPGDYPGASFLWPTADWSGYDALAVEVHISPGQPLHLEFQVQDQWYNADYGDCFHVGMDMLPGWHTVRFPLAEVQTAPKSRRLDLRHVTLFQLFTPELKSPRTVFVDHIRLERMHGRHPLAGRSDKPHDLSY